MKIVIAGAGTTGRALAEALIEQEADITFIDSSPEKTKFIEEHYDVLSFHGDCLSHSLLRHAGVATCDIFIGATRSDSANLLSCQLAKRLGAKYCVSRIFSDDIFPNNFLELESHLGIDWLLSPNKLAASTLTSWVQSNNYIELQNYFSGRLNVVHLSPQGNSNWYSKPMGKVKLPPKTKIIGYSNHEGFVQRDLNHVLQEEEKVLICGLKESIVKIVAAEAISEAPRSGRKNIYIAGVDRVIKSALQNLGELHPKITIYEKDKAVCEALQGESWFQGTVIHTDFTDIDYLREQNIDNCKLFVCGSKDDAENLLTALNARELKIPNIISIVHHSDKYNLFKRLKIDIILPNHLVAQEFLRYFNLNLTEAYDFVPNTTAKAVNKLVGKNSELIGKNPTGFFRESDLSFEVVAVWRRGSILVDTEDLVVEPYDKVLVASLEGDSKALKKVLKL